MASVNITLDQAPRILQTTEDVFHAADGDLGSPWIVAAAARALESGAKNTNGQTVVLAATGCPHAEGLSTWVAILGPGSARALGHLRDEIGAAGLPVYLESAPLSEYPFVPLLVRERSMTSLLFPKGGGPSLNDWVLAMVDDVNDIANVAAVTERIAKRFSFRDVAAVGGGFAIEPLPKEHTT